MVSVWNCLKYYCVFFCTVIIRWTETFCSRCIISFLFTLLETWSLYLLRPTQRPPLPPVNASGLDRPWGFQEAETPRFHDCRHMEVARLSALPTDRFYSQEIFLVLISGEGRDSAVDSATRYGLDGPGIESWWGRDLPHLSGPFLGRNQPPIQCGTESFPRAKRSGCGIDHPLTSSAEVKERVELYLYPPSGPSWPVLGRTWPFTVYLFLLEAESAGRIMKPLGIEPATLGFVEQWINQLRYRVHR
jgi:hypothetical protein